MGMLGEAIKNQRPIVLRVGGTLLAFEHGRRLYPDCQWALVFSGNSFGFWAICPVLEGGIFRFHVSSGEKVGRFWSIRVLIVWDESFSCDSWECANGIYLFRPKVMGTVRPEAVRESLFFSYVGGCWRSCGEMCLVRLLIVPCLRNSPCLARLQEDAELFATAVRGGHLEPFLSITHLRYFVFTAEPASPLRTYLVCGNLCRSFSLEEEWNSCLEDGDFYGIYIIVLRLMLMNGCVSEVLHRPSGDTASKIDRLSEGCRCDRSCMVAGCLTWVIRSHVLRIVSAGHPFGVIVSVRPDGGRGKSFEG